MTWSYGRLYENAIAQGNEEDIDWAKIISCLWFLEPISSKKIQQLKNIRKCIVFHEKKE